MNELKRLQVRHRKIMELELSGCTKKEIAEVVGVSEQTVINTTRSPIYRHELNRRLEEMDHTAIEREREAATGKARIILEKASDNAAERVSELMDSEDPNVALRASNSILDRVLGKAGDRSGGENNGTVINVQTDQLNLLVQALKESRNGQNDQSADVEAADSPDARGRQGNVCEASDECSGVGYRPSEAQGDGHEEELRLPLIGGDEASVA